MEFLKQQLGSVHGGRVLDFATGKGQSVRWLMDSFGGLASVVGVDIQDPNERVDADLLDNSNLTWLQIDGKDIPFADEHFDTVCIANALHHLKPSDISDIVAENMRVLKAGGRMIIIETVCDGLTEAQKTQLLFHHWRGEIDRLMGREHNPTYATADLTSLVASFGLEAVEVGRYVPQRDDCTDTDHLNELALYMESQLDEVREHHEYGRLKARCDELVKRMHRHGFLGATSMIFIGRKKQAIG